MNQAPTVVQGSSRALKNGGQLLDVKRGRIVELRRVGALAVGVDQLFSAGKGQLPIAGVDLAGKIMGLRGEVEDTGPGGVGEAEFGLIGLALVRVGRDLCGALIDRMPVGRDGN